MFFRFALLIFQECVLINTTTREETKMFKDEYTEFHLLFGQTMMYLEVIERDIRITYVGMLSGDFKKNYQDVRDLTVGELLKRIESLDKAGDLNELSDEDYSMLRAITNVKSQLEKKSYGDFCYVEEREARKQAYDKALIKITDLNHHLGELALHIEVFRASMIKKYDHDNRIKDLGLKGVIFNDIMNN